MAPFFNILIMHVVKKEMVLTKLLILSKTTEEEIFAFYIKFAGGTFRLNGLMLNPLREDNNEGCTFYYNKFGRLIFKDNSDGHYSGDCFNFVKSFYQLNNNEFYKILEKIDKDMGLELAPKSFNSPTSIRVVAKNNIVKPNTSFLKNKPDTIFKIEKYDKLTQLICDYYDTFEISMSTLNKFDIKSLHKFYFGLKSNPKTWTSRSNDILIAYPICEFKEAGENLIRTGNLFHQVYRPMADRKSNKFRGNTKGSPLMGYDKLPLKGDVVFITSSMKEIMVYDTHELPAVAPIGECTNIPKMYIKDLQRRFKRIVINFDNDEAGMKATETLLSLYPDMYMLFTPEEQKDLSDFQHMKGYNNVEEFLYTFLNEL
jgi:hypothetical protein